MNIDSQLTTRRNVFWSLLITICVVVIFLLAILTDQGQHFVDGVMQRLQGRLRL